jgi:hypothetical protein
VIRRKNQLNASAITALGSTLLTRLLDFLAIVCNKKSIRFNRWLKSDVFDEGISGFFGGRGGRGFKGATVFKQTIELLRVNIVRCGIVSGKQFNNYEPHNHVYNDVCVRVCYSIVVSNPGWLLVCCRQLGDCVQHDDRIIQWLVGGI